MPNAAAAANPPIRMPGFEITVLSTRWNSTHAGFPLIKKHSMNKPTISRTMMSNYLPRDKSRDMHSEHSQLLGRRHDRARHLLACSRAGLPRLELTADTAVAQAEFESHRVANRTLVVNDPGFGC